MRIDVVFETGGFVADEVVTTQEVTLPEVEASPETVMEVSSSAESPPESSPESIGADIQAKYEDLLARHARLEAFFEASQAQESYRQQTQREQETSQQRAIADPEPDAFEQPREHAAWVARQMQAQFDARLGQIEQADFNRRCNAGEEWLEEKNLLDDYRRIVKLTDPNNQVKQYLDRNPDVWRDLWSSANPPKRLYQIAKDLEVRSPEGFETRVKDEVGKRIKDEVDRAVAAALGKRVPVKVSSLRPSVANLSSAPEGHMAKEPKEMTDEELSSAWRASWRQHRMG